MNAISLINRVKYNKTIYNLYFHIGSFILNRLKFFVKTDDRMIVFVSFGGRKYDDSPKAIYEAMLKDSRFDECRLLWAFIRPDNYILPRGGKVKIDTFAYYKALLKARVWVTNSSMTRGLRFSGRKTFLLNTWHGSAIKRMGRDINEGNVSFGLKRRKYKFKNYTDLRLAQGQYDVDIFSRAQNLPKDCFRIIGLPRNDELANTSSKLREEKKSKLGIPKRKKVILYAPTYREYDKDERNNVILTPALDLEKWREKLGSEYVLLFRAHYEVAKIMGVKDNGFVKNVSTYPYLNDLIIASDLLISDYSSIFFDYSIQGKPMLCYCYDYDKYAEKRGMYFDIREYLPYADNEEQLLELIQRADDPEILEYAQRFQNKFVTAYGNASKKALNIIHDFLKHNDD